MAEPIFFISHFRIRPGGLEELRRLALDTAERLRAEKPRTVLFLSYVDEDRGVIDFLHALAASCDSQMAPRTLSMSLG